MSNVCIFPIVLKRFDGIVESHEYISIEALIKHVRDISKKLFHLSNNLFRDNHTPSPSTTLLPFHDFPQTILTFLNRI